MKNVFLFFIMSGVFSACLSQASDFILLKKDKRTVKNFFVGSEISFTTSDGNYSGKINVIQKDSIFLTQYDIRRMPTNLGVYVLDTVAFYRLVFNYHDIIKIVNEKKGFNWSASGASLLGGGILITTVGLGTWVFTKPGTQYYASPKLIIGSAILGGVGYLLLKSNNNNYTIGKKYKLEYIPVK